MCHDSDSFWLRQEPKESGLRMSCVRVSICDFPQIMSSSSILKSPGGSRAGKQASKQADMQALWGHLVGAMPYRGLLSHYLAPGAQVGAAGPGGDMTT